MSDLRINWIDEWEKKDVNLEELHYVLESGGSARYSGKVFRDIDGKWKKYAKCDVSSLYLLKETEDGNDGPANAYYAYSTTDGMTVDENLEQVRVICAKNLSTSEMRAACSFCKPSRWWDINPSYYTKLAEKGETDSLYSLLIVKLSPTGILLTSRSVKKEESQRLACSVIVWGLKEGGLFKKGAYMSCIIDNEFP